MQEVFGLPGRGESHVVPIFQRMIHQFYHYALEFNQSDHVLAQTLDTSSLRSHMADYVRRFYREQFKGDRWVDKTPGAEAILGAEFILEIFPTARFLLMRRNGIEIVQSARKKFSVSFEDACSGWANCMESAGDLRARRAPVLELDQFELTNSPDVAAGKIAAYLGRPDKEIELASFFVERRVDKTSDHDWSRRITLADVAWSDDQRRHFRAVCGPWMERSGYPLE